MDDVKIIFPINLKPSLIEFFSLLSVSPKGFAAQLLEPVYWQIFINSTDLKAEYNKYYSIEYKTLGNYLEVCHGLDLSEDELDKKFIFKFKNSCQLTDPAYDRDYLDRIITQLRKLEASDEN